MTFAWPLLLLLLVLPGALLAWEFSHRRRAAALSRPKILRAEAGPHSLRLSPFDAQPATVAKPRFWLCAGLALAIVALARPQWGRLEEPVFDQSREILLAIDLSRSMLTPDVKPSRLERSKLLIQSLLERLAGERVGLAVFAGTAFLQSPLSADYEILREFLPALGPDFLPEGGSNYGALIETALGAFGTTTAADRFLVILSDGEATDEEWKAKVDELKKKNIRVLGLGVGTAGGGMIPDANGQFVKDERGAVVLSKLESATLQQLAQATGGVYRDASAWVDLAGLVNETIEAGRKGEFVEKQTVRLVERFQWPLAFGLWCLLMSLCYEFPVRPRPRTIALRPAAAREQGTGSKEQALHPTTVSLVLLLLALWPLLPAPARAASAASPAPAQPPAAAAAPAPAPEPSPLVKIVSRLAGAETRTARDWAELGRETVSWGSRLQSEQQPVSEGPVRDALAAVDLGRKLDPKATDWKKLREELEALLQKPDEEKQDKQDKQDQQNQDDQKQDQQKQDQDKKSDQQKKQEKQDQQKSKSDQKDSSQQEQQPQDAKPPEPKPQGESAFGDMNKKDEPPPPPPPESTQKVGGAPEKKDEPPPQVDPSLALPMQKLEQLRNQDSPAQLFQLMEGEKKPTKKTGKDW
ncbi:MAG: VWA domain-containing protein [Opitutaceae bacterium]|nr:VWA domain-containing protein [Opitutaceae bacterium]